MDKTRQLTLTDGQEVAQEIPQEITEESRQELTRFYDALDSETREFIQAEEQDIVIIRAYADIVTGQKLAKIKARLPHGQWGKYLRLRWNASERHAQNLMKIAEAFKNEQCSYLGNLDKTALKMLAYAPESAREEALCIAESGERITHQKAQEIVARHKAELEATKKAAQQTITTLEEQIMALEDERCRLRAEHNRAVLTKQADDQAIIRQEEVVRKLNRQIEELKAKQAQPQVIEKEVEKIVEVVKAPDDYEQLKGEVETLREKLKTTRQKSGEELSHYQKRVDDLTRRLAQKEEALASFDVEQKQLKALRKISEGENCILEAMRLLEGSYLSQPGLQETITRYIESIRTILNRFADQAGVIDSEVVYDSACAQ